MGGSQETTNSPGVNPAAETDGPATLAEWTEFHQHVESLPDEDREVFELTFYHGLSQAEIAAMLDISVRTVKRRWQDARIKLNEMRGGEKPGH